MDRCGRCGSKIPKGLLDCPECGGTALPSGPRFQGGALFQSGQRLGDRFVVEQILGSGSSGAVYGVHDELLNRRAALKILWEEAAEGDPAFERLRREIKAAQSIQDPRVVAVYELLILEGHPALVMEWVEGSTLRQRVRCDGPQTPDEAARVLCDILGALSLLNGAGIVHRDVKSGNILVTPDGAVKLGDFGLVKGDDLGGATLTATGMTLGTPGYMAPEVIRGEAATPRSDLYGAGVILFELLAGRLPFEGNSAVEVAGKHLTQQVPIGLLREKRMPRWLTQFASRLLEKDPSDRFPSPKAALAALERRRGGLWLNRRARRYSAAAALLLGAALSALWLALRPGTITATFHDAVLETRSASGGVLWSRTLPTSIQSAVAGRFGPKGSWAVACAANWNDRGPAREGLEPSEADTATVWVFDRSGKLLVRFPSPMAVKGSSRRFNHNLSTHRFAPDENERLVLYARHATWHPTGLLVFSFQQKNPWDIGKAPADVIVSNSGAVAGWTYKDLNGDGRDEVLYAGVNMPLYWANFAAAAKVPAPNSVSGEIVSPDSANGLSKFPLFYRLFSLDPFISMRVAEGPSGMPLISLGAGDPWTLGLTGTLLRGGRTVGPPDDVVARFNRAFPNLCYLREGHLFAELLDASGRLPSGAGETYDWIKALFRASALQGLGRHDEVVHLMLSPDHDTMPAYARQLALDALFLAGDYPACISLYDSLPAEARTAKPELGNTALLAALCGEEDSAFLRLSQNTGSPAYDWYPGMLGALQKLMRGDLARAPQDILSMGVELDQEAEPRLLLAECLIRQGRLKEAHAPIEECQRLYQDSSREIEETDIWLKWREGSRDPALLPRVSALLNEARLEARTSPRARAFLPLSLDRAARMHRESGDLAGATALSREAVRLAPKSWRAALLLK